MPNRTVAPIANAGEPSAAGASAAGTRRYPRVIDAHMHWYPQEFVDLMIRKGPANGAVMGEDENGNPVVVSVPGCTQKSTMRKTHDQPRGHHRGRWTTASAIPTRCR